MELIKYEIQKGETLDSIAKKQDISVKELVKFHNENCGLTNMIIGNDLPIQMTFLLLEKNRKLESSDDKEKKARYRCEQINTSKFNGNLVHFVEQNFQYLVKTNFNKKQVHVTLEDYTKKMSPVIISDAFDFIEATEKIKNNVNFELNSTGKIIKILNKKEISENWNDFKANTFHELNFIKSLKEVNPSAVQELSKMGDQQFSESTDSKEEYWRNFFYFCCFDQYLFKNDNWDEVDFDFISTIVPPILIPLNIRYDKVDENEDTTTIRKVAEYIITEDLAEQIKIKYNEFHKAVVKYDFTAYKLIFRATVEIDTVTRILKTGKVVLREEILDNIENECIFTVKKLENFTQ